MALASLKVFLTIGILLLPIAMVFADSKVTYGKPDLYYEAKVSGKVTDAETGEALVGASVVIKGTYTGTATDTEGNYSLTVPSESSVLVFSYLGYSSKEVIAGSLSVLDIALEMDESQLQEIVVTALGKEREKRALGYSVQEVKGAELTQARETNVINSLSGKIAGVQITNSSGAIGASSNIQIRGQNFIGGYNQNNSPLFVVDGIPISNNNEISTRSFSSFVDFNNPGFVSGQEVDYGNAAAEINPDDIESVTVLKGPNAAALYGSRAANGVVLITTKSGKKKQGLGISFNSNYTFETPLRLPDFQMEFGQGRNGQYEYVNGSGGGVNDGFAENFGPRLDGRLLPQFDSPVDADGNRIPTPFVAYPNQLRDFLQTGKTVTNSLSINGGNEKANFRLSYTNLNQKGIVPNTDLKRNTIALSSGYEITPKLNVKGTINYVNTHSDNRPTQGAGNNDNIMRLFLRMGRNVNPESLRNYWQEGSGNTIQNSPIWSPPGSGLNNPYFVVNENLNGNSRDRVFGNVAITYDFTDDLNIMVRSGRDFYNDRRKMRRAVSSVGFPFGYYQEDNVFFLETNTDVLLNYGRKINDDFEISVSVGGNQMRQTQERLGTTAGQLTIPNVYNLTNNAVPLSGGNYFQEKRINSIYGTAQVNFQNYLYLDLTGRNDWSSALPVQNNSYFYPSVSLSSILTDAFDFSGNFLNFSKLRASFSSVRRDLDPYQTSVNFRLNQGWGGTSVATYNDNFPNPNIRPERVDSYEIGLDNTFLNGRVRLDLTYYFTNTTDLIIASTLTPSSGYSTKLVNVGRMTNKGVEVMLNLNPIKVANVFNWNIEVNFARNVNRVVNLSEEQGIDRIRMLERWASLELRTGASALAGGGDGSFGSMYGDVLRRDENGNVVHRNGIPLEQQEWLLQGNFNPDWTAGINNIFRYKDFTLNALFSIKQGGEIYSRTFIEGNRVGSLRESTIGRDENGGGSITGPGVNEDGTPNMTPVSVRDYWRSFYDNDVIATFDGSYVKLREVILGYTLRGKLLDKTPFQSVNFSIVGRNLFLWTKVPNIDPETSTYSGQFQGVEQISLPSVRSYGFNLKVNF